jgi:isocitrate lyase
MGVPTVLLARTDAEAADLLTSDVDENDRPHCTGERTMEGFYKTKPGFEQRRRAASLMHRTLT